MKSKHFILILLSAIATSCTIEVPEGINALSGQPICLTPKVAPRISTPTTKSVIENGTIPAGYNLTVSAYYNSPSGANSANYFSDAIFTVGGGMFSGDCVWPEDGTLDILAFGYGSLDVTDITYDSNVSRGVSFHMPDNSTTQTDVLFGHVSDAACAASVDMPFRHAGALVVFTALSTVGRNALTGTGITINGISLNDTFFDGDIYLESDGTVTFDTSTSTEGGQSIDLPGLTAYDVPVTAMDISAPVNRYGIGGRGILVMPQPKTSVTVDYTLYYSGTPIQMQDTISLSGEWESNNMYNVILSFDDSGLKSDVEYNISVNKSSIEYSHLGTSDASNTFTVTSTNSIRGNTAPSGWKTQVLDNGNWVDLSSVSSTDDYSWLASFPTLTATPASTVTAVSENIPARSVSTHEEVLKSNRILTADGTATVDNSTQANAVDLSKYDFVSGHMETTRYTANCYVVSSPGWYKLPLIYGNAIENDAIITLSYDPTSIGTGHLDGFKNYKFNLSIAEPWIEQDWRTWLVSRNSVHSAGILWERYNGYDEGIDAVVTDTAQSGSPALGVVDGVQLQNGSDGKYILFHIDEDNIRPGNFLIVIRDAGGDASDEEGDSSALIMWSWHIWITDQPMAEVTVNNGSNTYGVLPVNVGWTDGEKGLYYAPRTATLRFVSTVIPSVTSGTLTVTQREHWKESTTGWGTYYQWGRKDPFLPGLYTYQDNYDMYMRGSIRHPDWFNSEKSTYFSTYYYDWSINNYDNLWDSQWNDYGVIGSALPNHKTVMDPSPRRFCVAPDTAWDGFTTYGHSGPFSNGYHYWTDSSRSRTLFFPATGFISYLGALGSSSESRYWTLHAWASLQRRASYGLKFTDTGTQTCYYSDNYRACGEAVRPVRFN